MDAPLRPPVAVDERSSERPAERSAAADSFVAQLTKEQERYLAAYGDARQVLERDPGQLSAIVAVQGRLTRQFFDAQRSLIRRRAETDYKVGAIGRDAASEADAIVISAETARARAALLAPPSTLAVPVGAPVVLDPPVVSLGGRTSFPPPPPGRDPFLSGPIPIVGGPRPLNDEIAGITTAAVRSADDAESLAQVIDEAFASTEPDGVAAERQLRELLDQWWRVEQEDERAAVDDATARAAMHLHLARVRAAALAPAVAFPRAVAPALQAPAVATVAWLPPPPATPELLPDPVAAALSGADHGNLDAVLASLLDHWEPAAARDGAGLAPPSASWLVSTSEPLTDGDEPTTQISAEEAFERFWGRGAQVEAPAVTKRRWLFPQLLVPAATVVAVLSILMLIIG
jgi:hypothetical protein